MFNPLAWFDGKLLDAVQKFCDKVQRLTGLTKFRLEKWAILLSTIFFWGCIIYIPDPLNVLLGLWNSVSTLPIVRQIERGEAEFLKNGRLELSLTHLASMRLLVVICFGPPIIISPFLLPDGLYQLMICTLVGFIAHVYFSACTPRPPSKSKAREWYEKALTWLNDRLKPAPIPVPS